MKVERLNTIQQTYPAQPKAIGFKRSNAIPAQKMEELVRGTKWWSKFLNYAGVHDGEMLNVLVTAFGTAVICPMFITYNPFSPEDKDTRKYSAWRQPISAIITMITSLSVTKWFNDWLAQMASTSNKNGTARFARADLRAKPPESYLKRLVKLEHPEYDDKKVLEEAAKLQKVFEKRAIRDTRKEYKNKQVLIDDMICQDSLEKAKDDLYKSLIDENDAEIKTKFGKPAKEVPSGKLHKFLDKKLEEKAKVQNTTSAKLIRQTAQKTVEREAIGETVLKTYIRELKKQGKNLEEAINLCTENELQAYINKCISEKITQADKFNGISASDIAKDAVVKLEHVKEYETSNRLKEFTSIKDLGKDFNEILHNVKVKRMVRAKASDASRVFKTLNKQVGLVVTLITLPFACGILNWAYPRIMEDIMPEMALKKKQTSNQVKCDGGGK